MKVLAYCCPFVPAEWISAHGLRPVRLVPRASLAEGASVGVCPYARAFLSAVSQAGDADGVVVTTACDQMRRISELIPEDRQTFLLHIPATWQTPAARHLYRAELERLGRFMVRLGGSPPSHEALRQTMRQYADARTALMARRKNLSGRAFAEAISSLYTDGPSLFAAPPDSPSQGIPLALVGGPLLGDDFRIFDLIESAGGRVALDATSSGERGLPSAFDEETMARDPLDALVESYFGAIPDAFRRPNSGLYTYLRERIETCGIRGIVFHYYVWCDTWHAEAERMKSEMPVPVLILSSAGEGDSESRVAARIEAFLEMLR